MQWNEVYERAAFVRQRGQLRRVLGRIVHATKHDVLEGDPSIEDFRGVDDSRQWIPGIDRHQRLTEIIVRRMNGQGETELLRSLAERDNSGKNPYGRDSDVPCADAQS
jgi:hypothetical protein